MGDVDFDVWAREERERRESKGPVPRIRPSHDLPKALVARADRIASVQGMTRSELMEQALESYLASWRARP